MRRHYMAAYVAIAGIVLLGGLIPIVMSGRPSILPFVVVGIMALVFPPILIWIARKMGYPIGQPVHCSKCQTELPLVRRPKNARQALWGGYDCPNCGAQLDARGRELAAP